MVGITATWSVATQHFAAKVNWVYYFLTFFSSVFCFVVVVVFFFYLA